MTEETQTDCDLLRLLVESFIDHPNHLSVVAKDYRDAVYWEFRAHTDDHPKIVGKRGAHVHALSLLVRKIGLARETVYYFELLEPEPGRRREASPPKAVEAYDAGPARKLLEDILTELGLGQFAIEVLSKPFSESGPLQYRFEIILRTEEDYAALTVPEPSNPNATTIGALGTLFRARARKDGVVIDLEVKRP